MIPAQKVAQVGSGINGHNRGVLGLGLFHSGEHVIGLL